MLCIPLGADTSLIKFDSILNLVCLLLKHYNLQNA